MKRLTLTAAATLALLLAAPARAQIAPRDQVPAGGMDHQLSFWGIGSYRYSFGGVGVGARYQATLLPRGLLNNPSIREDLGVEGGVDFVHYSWGYPYGHLTLNEFSIVVGPVWNFWLTPQFAVYPKIEIGAAFGGWTDATGGYSHPTYDPVIVQGAVGAVFKAEKLTLRLELGSAYARAGIGFTF